MKLSDGATGEATRKRIPKKDRKRKQKEKKPKPKPKPKLGPGFYSDVGKKARDLLHSEYQRHQKFTVSAVTASGAGISATVSKTDKHIFTDIQSQLKIKNITVGATAISDSKLFTTATVDKLATPGLKGIFSFVFPDRQSGKVELEYLHRFAGVRASFGLTANPIVNLSGAFGTNTLSVGADILLNTASGAFTKQNAAFSITNADLIASLALKKGGNTLSLTASYYHLLNLRTSTAVGAELTHVISTDKSTFTFGAQHALNPSTTVKARVNNHGKVSALVRHQWRPKSFITISGEIDIKATEKRPKVCLSLMLKP